MLEVMRLGAHDLPLPARATDGSAGFDLRACLSTGTYVFSEGESVVVRTGFAWAIPSGFVGLVYPRSGLATKRSLVLANTVGVIDSDYRGEIMCCIRNQSRFPQTITHGDRIAQLVVTAILPVDVREVSHLSITERGAGGFGSSGVG